MERASYGRFFPLTNRVEEDQETPIGSKEDANDIRYETETSCPSHNSDVTENLQDLEIIDSKHLPGTSKMISQNTINNCDSSRRLLQHRRRRRRRECDTKLSYLLSMSFVNTNISNNRLVAAIDTSHCLLLVLLALASIASISHGQQFGTNTDQSLAAEARAGADTNLPSALKPPLGSANNIALNQLVNFLNSINQQQQQQNGNNQRRSPAQPLPLGQMGSAVAGQNRPMPVSSSTPVNPFVAAINFQPTRRQQQQPPQPFNNQQPFTPQPPPAASSSSPPALTLNRIANQFASNQPFGPSNPNAPRFTNSQQLKPLNTIPLGGQNFVQNPQNNQFGNNNNRLPQPPTQNQRRPPMQQMGGSFQQQPPGGRSPLMPPPLATQSQAGIRPLLTGFAPSGPPPSSTAAANTAISVVQSPPNAIGQPPSPFEMPLDGGGGQTRSPPSSTTEPSSPTVTATSTTTTTTSQQPVASSSESVPITVTQPATTTSVKPPPTTTTTTTTSSSPQNQDAQATTTTQLTMISSSVAPVSSTTSEDLPASGAPSSSPSSSSPPPSTSEQPVPTTTTTVASEHVANSSWNPVQQVAAQNKTRSQPSSTSLAPSPDIVTVPPGYNPDAPPPPQSYDISVSAQMGGGSGGRTSNGTPTIATNNAESHQPPVESSSSVVVAAAPTETTTIIWSSETSSSTSRPVIQPTRTHLHNQINMSSTVKPSLSPLPSRIRDSSMMQNDEPQVVAAASTAAGGTDQGVVYGKAPNREAKPTRPPPPPEPAAAGRPFIQTAQLDTQVRPFSAGTQPVKSNHGGSGSSGHLPFKPSKQLNAGGTGSSSGGGGGGGGGMSVGSGFSIAATGNQTMPTGDIQDYVAGAPPPIVSVNAAGSSGDSAPTISAQGGPDPATFDLAPEASSSSSSSLSSSAAAASSQRHSQPMESSQQQAADSPGASAPAAAATPTPRLRRPTFKPKPAVPPIRIDSCIVGDDSSCDQSHNERCVTEYGISSCHCKPGFARLSQLRGYCSPISLLQFNMKIDRLSDDRRLAYNSTLENPNSEEYQYLEFETLQALASAMQQTSLAKQYMGARVNKFYERKNKVWANVSLNLELNNLTRNEAKIQQVAHGELLKLATQSSRQRQGAAAAATGQPLGESTLVLDGSRESISKLVDVNECASRELNDCSKHATCTNEFGGYSCQCLPGYEDKLALVAQATTGDRDNGTQSATHELKARQGRVCMGCSAAYCSNRGECSIQEGRKQCKCRANFMGSRCDIDSEVLAVAIGGSLVGLVILIITFWCLFVYNRRWRREQQKMDAVSATSGLTYNYVNSGANTNAGGSGGANSSGLMSPVMGARNHHHHQAGIVSGRSAYTLGGGGGGGRLGGGSRANYGYHASGSDQQAIIGSTSSGSSAASQPIACNPYAAAAAGAYEDGLLIAPASTGSSEQTSPSANSYRGIMGHQHHHSNHSVAMLAAAGNAYTLSGHHHHHNHHHLSNQQQQQHYLMEQHQHQQQQLAAAAAAASARHMHHHYGGAGKQLTQFHPSANGCDTWWRTLQQADNVNKLAGYYIN